MRLRIIAFILVFSVMGIFPFIALAEDNLVTFEQMESGEYEDTTVKVRAKVYSYDGDEYWAVQKSDGSYARLSPSYNWRIDSFEYEALDKDARKAVDNAQPCILTVWLSSYDTVDIMAVQAENKLYFGSEGIMGIAIMIALFALFMGGLLIFAKSARGRRYTAIANATPVKTKFIDSSHTMYKSKYPVDKTTFMVYYDNGERRAETISNSSSTYRKYMDILDDK